jgi:Zn ribbon nucleic-acid-binding protein
MSPAELIDAIKANGGVLAVDGDEIVYQLPKDTAHLLDVLRERKSEVMGIVKAHGGRIANFPHCPRCASYALYRKDNIGLFECQTCGLTGIEESTARRLM